MRMTKAEDLRALRLLIDTFDADIIFSLKDQPELTPARRALNRGYVEDDALLWHEHHMSCATDPRDGHQPIMPLWSPYRLPRPGRVAVIGPCPTWDAVKHGGLGWSRAERMLSDQLRGAGIGRDMVTWINACWCWPAANLDGRGHDNRPPTNAEIDTWKSWTLSAIEAADVRYVLLHGAHAVRVWRPDLKVTALSGDLFLWNDKWFVTPIPHASNVMRENGLPIEEWKRGLSSFAGHVTEDVGLSGFSVKCIHCNHGFYAWDGDGVPYCSEHFNKFHARRDRAQQARGEPRIQQGAFDCG